MMMIIFILTASYIWDDVRIVYALAIYDAIFFGDGGTEGGTNKAIVGLGWFHSFSYFGMLNVENLTPPKIYGCWQITKSVGSAFNTFNASYNTYILHTSYNTFMQCHHSVSTS